MRKQEAVCLGTAILAGVAAGTYGSVAEAVDQVVQEAVIVEPDAAITAAYREQSKRYRLLRSAMTTKANA